jgi:predicted nucleic acid-binding protein
MAGSTRYTAVLDACVLYPAPVRDILLSLAHQGLYHARWSHTIHDEWIRNLLIKRPDISEPKLRATAEKMTRAIPDALITGYERFISTIDLPDPDDRHVVAAALVGHADAIVTFNLKDFPSSVLEPLGIEAQHPDDFVVNQLHLNLTEALKAIKAQRQRLERPTQTAAQLLTTLGQCGLPQTALLLSENAELI